MELQSNYETSTAKPEINKELIQQLHDAYMERYTNYVFWCREFRKLAKGNPEDYHDLTADARLEQGKFTALEHVINDLRHILGMELIGDAGYVFNQE